MITRMKVPSAYCLRAWTVFVARHRNWKLWAYFLATQIKFEE